jgi:hypothetical protein
MNRLVVFAFGGAQHLREVGRRSSESGKHQEGGKTTAGKSVPGAPYGLPLRRPARIRSSNRATHQGALFVWMSNGAEFRPAARRPSSSFSLAKCRIRNRKPGSSQISFGRVYPPIALNHLDLRQVQCRSGWKEQMSVKRTCPSIFCNTDAVTRCVSPEACATATDPRGARADVERRAGRLTSGVGRVMSYHAFRPSRRCRRGILSGLEVSACAVVCVRLAYTASSPCCARARADSRLKLPRRWTASYFGLVRRIPTDWSPWTYPPHGRALVPNVRRTPVPPPERIRIQGGALLIRLTGPGRGQGTAEP